MTATITYPNDEASRGLCVVATASDLPLVLVQRLAITYPDGEVARGLDVVATASDLLPVLVPGDDGVGLAEDDAGHVD